MGGDEFCVLLPGPEPDIHGIAQALWENGEGFDVTSAYGAALIPDDATTVSTALSVADERLYAHKELLAEIRRGTAHEPLLRTLAEREPELRAHVADVSSLAVRVGQQLGPRARRDRGATACGGAPRRRQARRPGRCPAEVRCARSDRVGLHPLAHPDRTANPERRPGAAAGRRNRPFDPRELGRHGLSRRACRRGDPARSPDHRRLRRLLGDDERPSLPCRADVRQKRSRSSAAVRDSSSTAEVVELLCTVLANEDEPAPTLAVGTLTTKGRDRSRPFAMSWLDLSA